MITIQEVAQLAGVSKSTVSRVLNNNGYVSQSSREKVEQIIKEYNYSPSAAAVNLSRQVTNTIGVVIPEIDNNFFGEVLHGITEISDQNDFCIICCDTANSSDKEDRALENMRQQRVRGLIITPAEERNDKEDMKRLQNHLTRLNVPVVLLDRYLNKGQWDGVYYENFRSGYIAASELIKAGNHKLGIITGDLNLRIARDRFHGFKQAVEDAGLTVEDRFILKGDFSIEGAYQLASKLFAAGDYPEGIVTCNNRTNLGFLKATRKCGVRIGRDIAVIGIDHVEVLDILDYNFSYVSRDTYEMGRIAMRLLCDLIENKTTQRTIQMVPCKLELKGSERRVEE